jgi:hypothetical protein
VFGRIWQHGVGEKGDPFGINFPGGRKLPGVLEKIPGGQSLFGNSPLLGIFINNTGLSPGNFLQAFSSPVLENFPEGLPGGPRHLEIFPGGLPLE